MVGRIAHNVISFVILERTY